MRYNILVKDQQYNLSQVEARRVGTMLLTPEETAQELRIARRRVFEMIRAGTLPSVKIGKSRRITREALARYVASLEGAETGVGGEAVSA